MLRKMQKSHIFILLSLLFIGLSAFVVWFSLSGSSKSQELRGQAYGDSSTCADAPVNTQFRITREDLDPWLSGEQLHPKVGEYIDVNCFAKNGAALLSDSQLSATLTTSNGSPAPLTLPTSTTAQLRHYQVTQAGRYIFTCKNTPDTCHDQDSFVVESTPSPVPVLTPTPIPSPILIATPTPTPSISTCVPRPACLDATPACLVANLDYCPKASPAPSGTCSTNKADLNCDGKVDINDYATFVTLYRQGAGL